MVRRARAQGTPPAIVERLNGAIAGILRQPDVAAAFETQGMVPAVSSPGDFARLVAKDAARWAEVVKKGGITAD